LYGCADTGLSKADAAWDTAASATDFSTGTASTQTEANDGTELAQYWDLQGTIWHTGVAPDPKQSELVMTLFSAKPELEALCTDSSTFTSTDASKARTPKWMTYWWDIEWPPSVCGGIPTRFTLGIGPYDPQLDPALAARGLSSKGLDSAYLQVTDDGPLYVFGVVSRTEPVSKPPTDSGDSGDSGDAASEAPAIYSIQGLQLLPL